MGIPPRRRRAVAQAATFLGTVALTVPLLAACTTGSTTPGPDASAGDSAKFTIAIASDLDTVDPAQSTTTAAMNVIDYGTQGLTVLDDKGSVQPALATSWDVSEDGKTLTFHLRKGVKFQDGAAFTATAAKFNLERLLDTTIKAPQRTPYTVISSVDAVDANTLKLTLTQPAPDLVKQLASTPASFISPDSVTKDGNTYKNIVHPVGTGPYAFKEFKSGQEATFTKFNDYWGKKPYYGTVVFDIVPEANTRESMLLSGQADMIVSPPVADLKQLKANSSVSVINAPSVRTIFMAMNNQQPPFNDEKVRQALNYAVDKQAIIKNILGGTAQVADSPLPVGLSGYCKAGAYPYDPEKAKALLKEAGVGDLSVVLGSPSNHYVQDIQASQAVAGYLSKVGVTAKVETTDWPSYLANITAPLEKQQYNLHMLGGAAVGLDAQTQFNLLRQKNWPPASTATSFYTNPQVETLINEGLVETDQTKRDADLCQAQKIIWNDAPWIFLWTQNQILAHSSKVEGITTIPNEKYNTISARPVK